MADGPDDQARPRTKRHDNATIIEALRQSGGVMAAAARMLNVSRETLYVWCRAEPEIERARDGIREETIDLAEAQLLKAIREGDAKSVHFFLRTVGKGRGYSERVVLATDPNAPLVVNHTHAFNLKGLDTADLEALERILIKSAAAPSGPEGEGGA